MQNQKGNTNVIVSFIIVVCAVGLVVYALMRRTETRTDSMINPTETAGVIETPKEQQANTQLEQQSTQTKKMEQTAKNGDILVMNYTGRLTNGIVFDSNVDPKFNHVEPLEFTLGAGQVIQGWDEGLLGMKIGEKKTLTISPEKGYGARGAGAAIPPNATLIFDVELIGIK